MGEEGDGATEEALLCDPALGLTRALDSYSASFGLTYAGIIEWRGGKSEFELILATTVVEFKV